MTTKIKDRLETNYNEKEQNETYGMLPRQHVEENS